MLRIGLPSKNLRRVLCLGAHCDDIEIGCGGTLLRLLEEQPGLEVVWIVFSSTPQRKQEAMHSAAQFLRLSAKRKVIIKRFRDSFFPFQGAAIKAYFELLKKMAPDLIFTHRREDLHQDHRLLSDLTWNTFRNNLILEYEIVKYDADLGSPNFYVPLPEAICESKVRAVLAAFGSQTGKSWFTEDTFRSILRLRGVECNSPHKFAEAFYARKLSW